MAERPAEYIRFIDSGAAPAISAAWTLTSPNASIWGPSITTDGLISMTDGSTVAGTPIFIGLDGNAYIPTIDNGGLLSVASGTAMTSSQLAAMIMDSNGVAWVFYVELDGTVNITTSAVLPALFRYPSIVMNWTPASSTDQLVVSSLRAQITIRRRTA